MVYYKYNSSKDSKKLQNIVKIRNRYTHDYYARKLARERIIKIYNTELSVLRMFLNVSEEKIYLELR